MRLRLLSFLVASCVAVAAHAAEPRGSFALVAHGDTIALERFEIAAGQLTGALRFTPVQARFDYALALDANERVTELRLEVRDAHAGATSAPTQSARITFVGDSAIVRMQPGGEQRLRARAGAVPYVNPSMLMIERVVVRALASGPGGGSVPVFLVSGGQVLDVTVKRVGTDSVRVQLGGVEMRLAVDAAGSVLGGTIPSQGIVVSRSAAVSDASLEMPRPDYSAPADAPYVAEEVRVPTRGGFVLAGTLTRPRSSGARAPVVVTITGSGPEDRDEALPMVHGYRPFRDVADALGRRGIAVLRLDDRGVGASEGRFDGATSEDFARDVEDAIRWLRARADVDPDRVALVGHSEGGLIAPLVASRDAHLRGIVLLAGPAYDGRRIIHYQQRWAIDHSGPLSPARRDSLVAVAAVQLDTLVTRSPWMRFFAGYDPLPTARTVRVPVLVLQGATDRQVSAEQAELLERTLRAGGNRDVTRRTFPDTDHLFLADPSGDPAGYAGLPGGAVRADVLDALAGWLATRLK